MTAPTTAAVQGSGQLAGRFGSLTVITSLRWWGAPWLRVAMTATRLFPRIIQLVDPQAVAFTRWSIVRTLPGSDSERPERLRRPWLVWETVFNGRMDPYIEQFTNTIAKLIRNTWGSSIGFPGTSSVTALREYIDSVTQPALHAYVAYADASVPIVQSALETAREHPFLGAAAAEGADAFRTAYDGFLVRSLQPCPGRGRAIGMLTVLTLLRPDGEQQLKAYFDGLGGRSPFSSVQGLHVARCVVVGQESSNRRYLLFTSVFDGEPTPFVRRLQAGMGPEVDEIWGACSGAPKWTDQRFEGYFLKHAVPIRQRFAALDASLPSIDAALTLRRQHGELAVATQRLAPGAALAKFYEVFPP